MAKNKTKKKASLQDQIKDRKKETGSPKKDPSLFSTPWFYARLVLVLVLGYGLYQGGVIMRDYLESDYLSQTGLALSQNTVSKVRGIENLRRAEKLAPEHPVAQFRLANAFLREESPKLNKQGYRAINYENLKLALDLLAESEDSYYKAPLSVLRKAQTAGILSESFRQMGEGETSKQFAAIASNNFYQYYRIHDRPELTPRIFYRLAMEFSMEHSKPQLVLTHYDNYLYHYGLDRINDPQIFLLAARARYIMGETALAISDLAILLEMDEDNVEGLSLLQTIALQSGYQEEAASLLRWLQNEGKLGLKGRGLLARIEKVS